MGRNLGYRLDSSNSPMREGDWITSPYSNCILKLISGELTIIDAEGNTTPGLGYGPSFPGDMCSMSPGGNLSIGPQADWHWDTWSPGAMLVLDGDCVPRIYERSQFPLRLSAPFFVLSIGRVIAATVVEVGRTLEATGLGIARIASQFEKRGVRYSGEARALRRNSPHPRASNGQQPSLG